MLFVEKLSPLSPKLLFGKIKGSNSNCTDIFNWYYTADDTHMLP